MKNGYQSRRVVVTGLGAVTPVGNNVADTWPNLIAEKSGIATASRSLLIRDITGAAILVNYIRLMFQPCWQI